MKEVRSSYDYPEFPYQRHSDQDSPKPVHHPVIVVGGGMVGLTMALDLRLKGIPVVVLEMGTSVSDGSRSICQAKRTLEIWDRLGAAERMVDEGITWKVGKVFLGDEQLYQFDLLPEAGHKMPAFINLQQYYVEEYLVDGLAEAGCEIRWQNKVGSVEPHADHVVVNISTPEGAYQLTCDWLISAEGVRSTIRQQLDLDFSGQVFEDKFLIADVKMKADFPSERWFWFDPSFHDGQTALMHHQANDIWRIDMQLGWDADPDEAKKPETVIPRLERMLGAGVDFDLEWISVYVFQCRTLDRYVHDRILFIGDAAHQVSPFGARGGNGGVQDADNLAWKLRLILDGKASASLLESFNEERLVGARENILNSSRATDFMTPKSGASRVVRDAVLGMAKTHAFARALVNPGRLSVPVHLSDSVLNTADEDVFNTTVAPGSPAADAPLEIDGRPSWLLRLLDGEFTVIVHEDAGLEIPRSLDVDGIQLNIRALGPSAEIKDSQGHARERYDLQPGTTYLFRPDQHVAGRWRSFDEEKIAAATRRACGNA